MKKTKLKSNIFNTILIILFAIFLTIFISNKYGYYEYQKHEQVTLTEEQIKKFEEDIKNGVSIDLENYLSNTNKNYQTKFSQFGLNVSNKVADIIKTSMDKFFESLGKMVTEK